MFPREDRKKFIRCEIYSFSLIPDIDGWDKINTRHNLLKAFQNTVLPQKCILDIQTRFMVMAKYGVWVKLLYQHCKVKIVLSFDDCENSFILLPTLEAYA